jgi:hypothetical protein
MNITAMLLTILIAGASPEWNAPAEAPAAQAAEHHAEFLRGRFQRWLDTHRATLTSRQVAAIREVIESPELFRAPQDPQAIQRQQEISHKLYCALGSELAYALANDKTPAQPAHTWTQIIHTWIDWVVECVAS